ncbi:MAG: hypothetical protein C4576_21450 [Desulfobacteraceae bacterium]|nr:MAG: hypothetical protein C4576_21450 [Desulfobacteraceae bacterium]
MEEHIVNDSLKRMREVLEKVIDSHGGKEISPFLEDVNRVSSSEHMYPGGRRVEKDGSVDEVKPKLEKVDPLVLKGNRVFSLFHDHEMTDQIALLRAQLIAKLNETGGNSLLITSALPGEGKTFISINLGVSLSLELDRSIFIIDADLKNPSRLHYDFSRDFFGINCGCGLADYLIGQVRLPQIFVNPGIERLTLLPAGRQLSNSAELLNSYNMKELVAKLKAFPSASGRILIFDSPSLLAPDALVLAEFVDGIVIVVEENRTKEDDLRHAMDLLKRKSIFGIVLNKSGNKEIQHV